ncbi:MAG: PAS domain S-box protein, partial [Anaerolineales bacterium]|nr:PAS domain S-box protein [Anaerolineales bacterium]
MLRLKRIWNRLDLRLTALVLLLTVLPLLALETFALNSSQRTLEQQQFDHLNAVTVLKSDEINRWVRNGVQRLNNLAQRPLLREYADALTRPDTPAADAQQARDNLLNNHLLPIRTEDGGFWRLFLLDAADGQILVSTDSSTIGESRSTESYFIEGQKGAYVQNVYFASALGEPAMSIGTPVRNSAGEVVAVLAGHLDLTELADIVGQSVDLTQTEDAYLINAAHFFITDPRFVGNVALRETIHTDGVNRCLQGQSGHGVYTDYRGTAVFGAYRWLPERELCVLTEIDEAEALASINALRQSWLLVGALVLAGVATSGLFFTRSITTPLRQLTQGAERVGQGDLQHQIPVRGQDEIGQLTTSFNQMTHSLRHAQQAAAAALASQTAIARQNARLVEQTRESEARYRAIVEHAAIGIARVDMAGRPVQVNPAMQAMLGYSEAELSQMVFTEFTHPEDAANDMALYQELIAGDRNLYHIEKRYIAKDGRLVWVQLIASLVRDADGEPQFAIGLVHDITTQKESQQELQRYRDRLEELVAARTAALRHSEARFRALFEAVPIPVLVTR